MMDLVKNYETMYICSQINEVIGKRYNVLPEDEEPEVKGVYTKETVAGFFRAWKLNELHFGILNVVNSLRVADINQIMHEVGISEDECKEIIDRCVVLGLLCENKIIFKDNSVVTLYIVDTGGIFALEEAGETYKKLNYTSSIDKKYNIYRKNIFLVTNKKIHKKVYFFEEILGQPINVFRNSVVLYDSAIAEKLGIKEKVGNELAKYNEMEMDVIISDLRKQYFVKLAFQTETDKEINQVLTYINRCILSFFC